MLSAPSSFLAALDSLCKDQIQQAGQRYTPGLDPTAPNLRIAALSIAVNNVACGESALARFQTVLEEFSEAWRRAKHCSQRSGEIQPLVDAAVACLPEMMPRFRARDAVAGDEWQERLAEIDAKLMEDVVHWQAEEAKLGPDGGDYSTARNTIRGNMDSIGSCLRVIRDEAEYAASPSFKLLFDPVLLIGGEWGTGKTHLLCDFTSDRLAQGLPTALVLAKNFQGNALAEICARLEPGASVEDQFAKLADAGSRASGRALFIVDGVNEGRRREWRKAVTESYHSVHNTFSGFDLPAPSIIQRLGLFCKDREIDFFDASGRPATLYREAGGGWVGDRHKLLYFREDLLKRYLAETRQVLVWCNWGERDWFKKMDGSDLINNPARQRVFQKHSHIHRTFSQWVAKDCLVL